LEESLDLAVASPSHVVLVVAVVGREADPVHAPVYLAVTYLPGAGTLAQWMFRNRFWFRASSSEKGIVVELES